jgi:hypothetical protein
MRLPREASFAVPLICGDTPDEDNLEVLEAQAHLDLLGRIIAQNRGTPDGTVSGRIDIASVSRIEVVPNCGNLTDQPAGDDCAGVLGRVKGTRTSFAASRP